MNYQQQGSRYPRGRRGHARNNYGSRGRGGPRGPWHYGPSGPNNKFRQRFNAPQYGGWQGSSSYHGPQFTPGTPQLGFSSPLLPLPTFQERSFRSPPPLPPARTSPLPGSEEYIQRNIKETSERIKKQLDLDNRDEVDAAEQLEKDDEEKAKTEIAFNNPCFTFKPFDIFGKESDDVDESNERPKTEVPKAISRRDSKVDTKYDVEEIRNKIIAHITNLSSGKKMNLINMGSESYDAAIHRIQKNERLTIIRALRDACSDQPSEATSILNTIIPDMHVKIEDLPADKREELSSSLKVYDDEMSSSYESTVDPDLMFQQAQEMLSGLPDDLDPVLEDVNIHQTDTGLCSMDLSTLNPELLPKNSMDGIENNLGTFIEPLEDPAAETLKVRELLNEPVISSDMHFRKKPVPVVSQKIVSSPAETSTEASEKQRTLEESYKQFEAEIFSSLVTYKQPDISPNEPERFRNDSGRFKVKTGDGRTEEALLPVDFNFSNSYLNFKNSGLANPNKDSDKKSDTKTYFNERDKQLLIIKEEQIRKHSSPNRSKDKKADIKIKTESEKTHISLTDKPKMSLDERIAKELRKDKSHTEKGNEHHRRKNEQSTTSSKRIKNLALEDYSAKSQSNTPPQTSDNSHDFLQPKASQKITETSEAHRKKIWRSPGEKKFMAEQKHPVSVYENSDTELDFSGPDTDDENKCALDNSLLSNVEADDEIKHENDPVDKRKQTESVGQETNYEKEAKDNLDVVKESFKTETFGDTQKIGAKHDAEISCLEKAVGEERKKSAKQRTSDTTKNSDNPDPESMKKSETKKSSSHQGNKHQRKRSIETDVPSSKLFLQNEANAELSSVGAKNTDAANKSSQQDDIKGGNTSKQDAQKNNNNAAKRDHSVKEVKHEKPISKSSNEKHEHDKNVGNLDKCATPMEVEPVLKSNVESTVFDKPEKNNETKVSTSKKDKPKAHSATSKVDTIKNSEVKTEKFVEGTTNTKQESGDPTASELTQERHEKHHSTSTLDIKVSKETTDNLKSKAEEVTLKVNEEVPKQTPERRKGRPRKSHSLKLDTKLSDTTTQTPEVKNDIASFKSNNQDILVNSEPANAEVSEWKREETKKTRSASKANVSKEVTEDLNAKNEEEHVKSPMGGVNLILQSAIINNSNVSTTIVSSAKVDVQEAPGKLLIKEEKTNVKVNEQTACVNPESLGTSHRRRGRPRKSRSRSVNKDAEECKDDQNKTILATNLKSPSDTVEVGDVRKRKPRKSHGTFKESDQNTEITSEKAKEPTKSKSELHTDTKLAPSKEEAIEGKSTYELNIKYSEKTIKDLEEGKLSGIEEQPDIECTKTPDTEAVKNNDSVTHLPLGMSTDTSSSKVERELSLSVRNSPQVVESLEAGCSDAVLNNANMEEAGGVSVIKTENDVLENSKETKVCAAETFQKVAKAKRGRSKKEASKNKRAKMKNIENSTKLHADAISVAPENLEPVENKQLDLLTKENDECNTQETNLKIEEPFENPECVQQKVENTKASTPKKQNASTSKTNMKDQEKSISDSEVNTGGTISIEPLTVKDEEVNLKRRSSRIKRSSKTESETVNNKAVEVATPYEMKNEEIDIPESAKRKKIVTRKSSREPTDIQSPAHHIILGQSPQKPLETEENAQTHRTRSKRTLKQHESIDCAGVMENTNLPLDVSSISETAVSTDICVTDVSSEKRKSKSKKLKKSKRRDLKPPQSEELPVEIKVEPSDTKIEDADTDLEVSTSFEENTSRQTEIPYRQSSLRVKSMAQLMPLPSNDQPESFTTGLKSPSQDIIEQAAGKSTPEKQKQKQNLRKRKLSDNEGPPDSKKQKPVTKHIHSQTNTANTVNFNSNDVASQTSIPCSSCDSYRRDMERKKKWIDELRKFDETIKSLLLAKAEIYDKLLSVEEPVRRVARKRTVPIIEKHTVKNKCKKVPSEVVPSDPIKVKEDSAVSLENPDRYNQTRTVSCDSKLYQPCCVELYRYSEEQLQRMQRDKQYLLYEENRRPCPRTEINTVDDTEHDGILNLRIVSVTSLAAEPENIPTVDPLETADKVSDITDKVLETKYKITPTITLNEEQLTTIFSATLNSAVLVLKVIDSELLAATDTGKIYCYNLKSFSPPFIIPSSNMAITSLCLISHKDGDTLCVGSLDATLKLYSYPEKKLKKHVQLEEKVQCMESMWGYIFMGSDKGHLTRYNTEKNIREYRERISESNVLVIKATNEGARRVLLVALKQSPVCVRDAMSGLLMRNMEAPFSPSVYTLLLEKNLLYCGTSKHDILVHNFHDGDLVCKYSPPQTISSGVVVLQMLGKLLFAGCYNGNIYVFSTATNNYLGCIAGPGGLLLSMTIVDNMIVLGTKQKYTIALKIPEEFLTQK